jgi:hypothetical protein
MQMSRAFWPVWAERLRHWKLDSFAAWLLEAGGPFTLLGAQALYFANPFVSGKQIEVLAQMLEEEEEVHAFANFLREEFSA